MSQLVFQFYRFLILPFAYFLLQTLRPFLSGKLHEMIEDKNSSLYKLKSDKTAEQISTQRPIWVHAASGEIEYARPVIRELRRQYPDVPILVTYSSPSAKKILESLQDIDVWAALPWDLPKATDAFIKQWNPRVLLFSRTDVWPVLMTVVSAHKIPTLLFSATFADNSSRLSGVTKYLTKHSLNLLSEIHCVSHEDISNLEALHLDIPMHVSGDTRFDQVFHRLQNPKALKSELIPSPDDFVFVAGSTWGEDEAVLLPALAKLKGNGFRVILAPHETTPQHLDTLIAEFKKLNLPYVRYSEATQWPAGSILLVDQVGILAELYTWGDIAFIGGSFKKQVHSVMEALAAGLPVMVGPYHRNNREALFYQKRNYSSGMIVQVVHSAEDIAVLLQRLKKIHPQIAQFKEEIRSEVGRNRNSTQRVTAALEKWF